MAAVIKAINARIRANPVTDYVCSTRTYLLPSDTRISPDDSDDDIPRRPCTS